MTDNNCGYTKEKAEIFHRRRLLKNRKFSPTNIVLQITKIVDPKFKKIIRGPHGPNQNQEEE
jgi:hypothetical protein